MPTPRERGVRVERLLYMTGRIGIVYETYPTLKCQYWSKSSPPGAIDFVGLVC